MAIEERKPLLDAPIPGMAMTHELGARPWQTAAQFTTVDETIDYYMSRMATEEYMEQAVEVLEMGIPITTIANTMQMAGVMEGKHSIDVGMLVTPLIMEMLMLIGDNAEVDYDDGLTDAKPVETSDAKIDKVRREMKERIDEVEDEVDTVDDEPEVEETKGLMARRV
tara:strand:+ start:99 stop:599 length:501 start_codon:yes stop_codon:yes gene_type:complete